MLQPTQTSTSVAHKSQSAYQDCDGSDEEAEVVRGKGPVPGLALHDKLLPRVLGRQSPESQQACPQPYLTYQGCQLLQLGFQHCGLPVQSELANQNPTLCLPVQSELTDQNPLLWTPFTIRTRKSESNIVVSLHNQNSKIRSHGDTLNCEVQGRGSYSLHPWSSRTTRRGKVHADTTPQVADYKTASRGCSV